MAWGGSPREPPPGLVLMQGVEAFGTCSFPSQRRLALEIRSEVAHSFI